jgi:outer membrane protein assembly factor BamB
VNARTRRTLAIVVPVALVVAGAGAYVGYRLYTGRCEAGFPARNEAGDGWLQWARAAKDADPPVETRDVRDVGPFGTWVSSARAADPNRRFNEVASLVGFHGPKLMVASQGGLPGVSFAGTLAAVDPSDGTVAWGRGFSGGSPGGASMDASTFVSLQAHGEGKRQTPQVVAFDARGGTRWCTELPEADDAWRPALQVSPTASGDLAVLHEPPAGRDGRVVTLLRGDSGEPRWSTAMPKFENKDMLVRPDGITTSGDRVVLAPFQGFHVHRSRESFDTTSPYPVVALDAANGKEVWRYTMPPNARGEHWLQSVAASTEELTIVVGAVFRREEPREQYRMAAIDRAGREVWHVDDPGWVEEGDDGERKARVVGDLLLVLSESGLQAHRLTDGSVAWRGELTPRPWDLRPAAVVGDYLLAPTNGALVVFDLRSTRQVGALGGTDEIFTEVDANDQYIALAGRRSLYVWKRK